MPAQTKMKYRGPVAVFFLPGLTLGIYYWVWFAGTKGEMNRLGAKIPTTWLLLVPFVNIWWLWKYSEGVQHVTDEGMNQAVAFILLLLLGSISMAIVQNSFNTNTPAESVQTPQAPAAPARHIDPATQLQRLHALKQRGGITQEEYDAKKRQLLGL